MKRVAFFIALLLVFIATFAVGAADFQPNQIVIDGKLYTLPCSIDEFLADGWSVETRSMYNESGDFIDCDNDVFPSNTMASLLLRKFSGGSCSITISESEYQNKERKIEEIIIDKVLISDISAVEFQYYIDGEVIARNTSKKVIEKYFTKMVWPEEIAFLMDMMNDEQYNATIEGEKYTANVSYDVFMSNGNFRSFSIRCKKGTSTNENKSVGNKYAVVNKGVNIRSKPDANSERLGSAEENTVFYVTGGENTSWIEIKYGNKKAYVSAKYVTIVDKVPSGKQYITDYIK